MKYGWDYIALEGITYNVLKKQQIKAFIADWIVREWKIDHSEFPDQPWTQEWLSLEPRMQFDLEIVDLCKVQLREDLMSYNTDADNFSESLKERALEREESLLRGVSTEPIIINEDGFELMDGYTRYTVLKKLGKRKVYAYVGRFDRRSTEKSAPDNKC